MPEIEIAKFSVKNVSVLDEKGNIDYSLMPSLNDDDVRTIYWYMNLARLLNKKMLNLQKQGKLGTFASTYGQEAGEVALAHAIKGVPNVWLAQSFRETAVMLHKDVPMDQILRYWGGYEIGSHIAKELHVLPVSIPISSQLNHAVGISYAMKLRGEPGAAIAFFGDGGTSEGEAHEAMNMAGVLQTPTIFFCQNNQYAISVPRAKQTHSETIAQKAIAYGFEGIQCDGNDIFSTYRVVKYALEKALKGGGPTFIEAMTYRLDNHTTADDWHKYRTEQEVAEHVKLDPMLRLRKYMQDKGMWNDEHENGMIADAQRRVDEAVASYETTPKPKVGEIFDYTYEKLPPILQEQKDWYVKYWGEHQ